MTDDTLRSANKGIVALAGLAVAAALFIAFTGFGMTDEPANTASTTTSTTAAAPSGLTVGMTEFLFEPDSFVVRAGSTVTLDLENTGGIEHNFVIMASPIAQESDYDEANALFELVLAPGESETISFEAPPAGTYQVVCSISGHFTAGMVAELTSG